MYKHILKQNKALLLEQFSNKARRAILFPCIIFTLNRNLAQ